MAAAAVDVARQAAVEIAEPDTVGEHLGVTLDEGGLTMHSFRCTARGYRGWRWAVTLAHVPDSDRVTVCDTVLLPGADSIQAPAWVPWSDRLAPGDLGAGAGRGPGRLPGHGLEAGATGGLQRRVRLGPRGGGRHPVAGDDHQFGPGRGGQVSAVTGRLE
jgi:hypothetical protein